MQISEAKSPNIKINAIGCHPGNIPDAQLLLKQWISTRVNVPSRGHLAIPEDISDRHKRDRLLAW